MKHFSSMPDDTILPNLATGSNVVRTSGRLVKCFFMCKGYNMQYNTEMFIKEYKEVHGNKDHTFTRTIFVAARTKITVTCGTHGDFHKTKGNHFQGKGCPKCVQEAVTRRQIEKGKLKFFKNVIKRYNNFYVYFLDEYVDYHTEIRILCPVHGEFWETPRNHYNGSRCMSCKHDADILPQSEAEERLAKFGNKTLLFKPFKYDGNKTQIPWVCLKCGHEDHSEFNNLTHRTNPSGCNVCFNFLTREQIDERINRIVPTNITIAPFYYVGTEETRVDVHCSLCDRDFNVYLWTLIAEKNPTACGCESSSKGEKEIREWLQLQGVDFVEQKRFTDCVYKQMMPFDFYIPDHNILLEFQGKQHFVFTPMFHKTIAGFKERQLRDKIKKEYAIDKGYNFLEYDYKQRQKGLLPELLAKAITT